MPQAKADAFEAYIGNLPQAEAAAAARFFEDFEGHCLLTREEKQRLRADFEQAILYYTTVGLSLREALERLKIENLGGFYSRPPVAWYALDDAAKIYPLSMQRGYMAVFRLSAYMKAPVVRELLQMALNFTIKRFPGFAVTVKKGFFWHYLDSAKRRYSVEKEETIPCQPLRIAFSGSTAFRVIYYQNRISIEYFHVLTDGTGGMFFLKALVAEYLRLLGTRCESQEIPDVNKPPLVEEFFNEFERVEAGSHSGTGGFADKPAVQMSGCLAQNKPCRIVHFKMDACQLKEAAKRRGVTVTAYMLFKMFLAGKYATDEYDGEMNMQVPVNMRKYYPSKTIRNFSMYCGVRFPLSEIADTPEFLQKISEQLVQKASKENMQNMLASTSFLVKALRYVPLSVKMPVAKLVYGFLGDRIFSSTLSNLGTVTMPSELSSQIDSMDFVLGPAISNRANCALVTFGQTTTLSVTKMTADPSFEEAMYNLLRQDGINPVMEGSPLYGNKANIS